MSTDGSRRRRIRWGIAAAVVAGALLAHAPLLRLCARAVIADMPLQQADAVLPMYQDPPLVAAATAAIVKRGYAPRVVLPRLRPSRLESVRLKQPRHEAWRNMLEDNGVPHESIVIAGSSIGSTRELASALVSSLGASGRVRVIVVASQPVSRLSLIDLRRAAVGLPLDITMHAVRTGEFDETNWWRSKRGRLAYADAYFLTLVRLFR